MRSGGIVFPENDVEYHISVNLFDTGFRQFFGHQFVGQPEIGHGLGGSSIKYNQCVYFHTSLINNEVLLVAEVIAHCTSTHGNNKNVSCGWTFLRLFQSDDGLHDGRRISNLSHKKLDLYFGSPRALYLMDDPIEGCQFLRSIPKCLMTLSVGGHKAMASVTHLIPENIIIGRGSTILGIAPTAGVEQMQKPVLENTESCILGGISITLSPSVDVFEEGLCTLLSNDRASRANTACDSRSIYVVERRLQVGVHNGWTYVDTPQVFNLEKASEQRSTLGDGLDANVGRLAVAVAKRRGSRFHACLTGTNSGAKSVSSVKHLVFKNQIHVNDLLDDPLYAVIFSLIYVISENLSEKDRRMSLSVARTHTRSVMVRWAVWNPFHNLRLSDVTCSLIGGAVRPPDDTFVFCAPSTSDAGLFDSKMSADSVSFKWIFGSKDDYMSVSPPSAALPTPAGQPRVSMTPVQSSDSKYGMMPDVKKSHQPIGLSRQGQPLAQQLAATQTPFAHPIQSQISQTSAMMHTSVRSQPYTYQPYYHAVNQSTMEAPTSYSVDAFPDSSELKAIPIGQVQLPILASAPSVYSGRSLTRSAYTRLYSSGFPPILDRNGHPPEVLDPALPVLVNLDQEYSDPLQSNEIIFQFMAFSRFLPCKSMMSCPTCVFFTFKFYRYPQVTTQRLMLSKPDGQLSVEQDTITFVLNKLDPVSSKDEGPPGLEVRYHLDPVVMKPGEIIHFLQHLSAQIMRIDVWDGDSLLPVGSCSVPLRYLCRGGHDAVQATFELDVVSIDQTYDGAGLTGDLGRGGSVRPVSPENSTNGTLHLRVANVGHFVDNKLVDDVQPFSSKVHLVVAQSVSNSASILGHTSALPGQVLKKAHVGKASHLFDNREVASLLMMSRNRKNNIGEQEEPTRESDSERLRKLARLKDFRRNMKGENSKTILGYSNEKTERMRDLRTMEAYRSHMKPERIKELLSNSLMTEHTIFPSFGHAEFFEFLLRNPFNQDHLVSITWNDDNIRVLTEDREWRHFKALCELSTPMEDGMFCRTDEVPQILLRAKETIYIPFKYQSFKADDSVVPLCPGGGDVSKQIPNFIKGDKSLDTKLIKVLFSGKPGNTSLSVLRLRVEPQPPIISQTFRFHQPENSFLRRSIRLPPFDGLTGVPLGGSSVAQVFTRCTDPNVILDCKPVTPGEPVDVFLKVAVGQSPQIKRFHVSVCADRFMSRPMQVWQCYVHAVQRVDVACTEGQTSRVNLLLRGTHGTRVVRCFSSHPREMSVSPHDEPFVLAAGSVSELGLSVRPVEVGSKFFFLNIVDVEFHRLVHSWLVCACCRGAVVSRAFTLNLPVGGGRGCSKRITYTNPYGVRKHFKMETDRPDLVQFKESIMDLVPGQSGIIGLRFCPVTVVGTSELLVSINDEEDKNEETFRITVEYK